MDAGFVLVYLSYFAKSSCQRSCCKDYELIRRLGESCRHGKDQGCKKCDKYTFFHQSFALLKCNDYYLYLGMLQYASIFQLISIYSDIFSIIICTNLSLISELICKLI